MSLETEISYCFDLPTVPRPEIGKILVTGATGYVGGRLVQELLNRGYDIRLLVRAGSPDHAIRWPGVDIVIGDALDLNDIRNALKDIKIVYYLIHSISLSRNELEAADIKAALHFRIAAVENHVDRIIFLGGLGNNRGGLSVHLQSRIRVAEELTKGTMSVTILRASMIIGSGSASFEILEHLAKNLPVILIPKWAKTNFHPIGIRDVIKYLVGVLEVDETRNKSYDIGGKSELSYLAMLKILSGLLNKRKLYIPVPITEYRFYGYVASLVTPLPVQIVTALFESAKYQVTGLDNKIKKDLDFDLLTFSEAAVYALDSVDQDKIRTRWSDAYPPAHELAIKMHELGVPKYTSGRSLLSNKNASDLFTSVCNIGGKDGWYHNNWIWSLRGMIDKLFKGVGSSRGRRSQTVLRVNDVIGFWRIEDIQMNERLLLRAEMKLPGKAWLEIRIKEMHNQNQLSVTAFFYPRRITGDIYWYFFVPFHHFIFKDLVRDIELRS